MYAIYLRAPAFYEAVPHAPAWMNVTFNRDRRAFMAAVDGRGEFAFHTQLREHEGGTTPNDADALKLFQAAVGADVPAEILACDSWLAGRALVADRFRQGRVFLAGDAVHLFTPTGGLGYNTAVDDAVNLGWKFAAMVKGYGGAGLLSSYETERRPLAHPQHPIRAAVRQLARAVRAGAGDRGRYAARESRRARRPGAIWKPMAGPSSTFPASRSAAATTVRRSLCQTAPRRRPMPPMPISRRPVRAAGRRICGSMTGVRCMICSDLNGRSCGSGRARRPRMVLLMRPRDPACRWPLSMSRAMRRVIFTRPIWL